MSFMIFWAPSLGAQTGVCTRVSNPWDTALYVEFDQQFSEPGATVLNTIS